jgi:hypothetical protein
LEKSKVREQLCFVHGVKSIGAAFKLDDYLIFHEQIDSVPHFDVNIFISNWTFYFAAYPNLALLVRTVSTPHTQIQASQDRAPDELLSPRPQPRR